MSTVLLDGNVLVAASMDAHVHHEPASAVISSGVGFATCPITQGTLVRVMVRHGWSADAAAEVLASLTGLETHTFWPDVVAYSADVLRGIQGHRQVTDAYLVALATHHGGRVVTVDRGLAATHPDQTELLEV